MPTFPKKLLLPGILFALVDFQNNSCYANKVHLNCSVIFFSQSLLMSVLK